MNFWCFLVTPGNEGGRQGVWETTVKPMDSSQGSLKILRTAIFVNNDRSVCEVHLWGQGPWKRSQDSVKGLSASCLRWQSSHEGIFFTLSTRLWRLVFASSLYWSENMIPLCSSIWDTSRIRAFCLSGLIMNTLKISFAPAGFLSSIRFEVKEASKVNELRTNWGPSLPLRFMLGFSITIHGESISQRVNQPLSTREGRGLLFKFWP